MGPLKSPELNSFGACIYQKYWKFVGDDVCKAVLNILHEEGMYSPVNSTCIALIPNKDNLDFISDSKHISFYNVLYKLVSNDIYNRLKHGKLGIISRT